MIEGTPLEGRRIVELSGGGSHTCALADDGLVACWGSNLYGELGWSGGHSSVPVAVETEGTVLDGQRIIDVEAGGGFTCARTASGLVACWGANSSGELGRGTTAYKDGIGALVVAGTPLAGRTIATIEAGAAHACALTTDGTLACWGDRSTVGIGQGWSHATTPVAPLRGGTSGLSTRPITSLSAGAEHTCAATVDGVVACWGEGGEGQLGTGETSVATRALVPVRVDTTATPLLQEVVVEVTAGGAHTCARTARGAMACWGDNWSGQLGTGSTVDAAKPVSVVTRTTPLEWAAVVDIEAGGAHTCARTANGAVSCWGTNGSGQLGRGPGDGSPLAVAPTAPGAPTDVRVLPRADSVLLTWTAPPSADPIVGYVVLPSVDGEAEDPIAVPAGATSHVIEGLSDGLARRYEIVARTARITGPRSAPTEPVAARPVTGFVPITPCRVLDTRASGGMFRDREIRTYAVRGSGPALAAQGGRPGGCGIPADARAVEAAVSAVDPAGSGFTRAWPADQPAPNATILNFPARGSRTNTGTLAIGGASGAELKLRNHGSRTHYVIDVTGYHVAPHVEPTARYVSIWPCRLGDSRGRPFAQHETRTFATTRDDPAIPVQGGEPGCGIPAEAVGAELSVTAVDPSVDGFSRVWPAGQPMPNATFLNTIRGHSVTNSGTVALGTGPRRLALRNFSGDADYVVDLQGYWLPAGVEPDRRPDPFWGQSGPTRYVPITPCRIADTRRSTPGPMRHSASRGFVVRGADGFEAQGGAPGGCAVPPNAAAVETTFTAVDPAAGGFLRVFPTSGATPNATILNFAAGQATTNTGSVSLAPHGWYDSDLTVRLIGSGPVHQVIEIQGYYLPTADLDEPPA